MADKIEKVEQALLTFDLKLNAEEKKLTQKLLMKKVLQIDTSLMLLLLFC